MGDYESLLNERGSAFQRRGNVDGYLRSYIYSPAFYLLSVARATQIVEAHCRPEEPPKVRLRQEISRIHAGEKTDVDFPLPEVREAEEDSSHLGLEG